ncbi:MAG: hypothetical protein H3C34_11875 [Caldilineaceae bacterium]|nr:hypothetical protein [Caldilineaceae bacterium]
MQSQTKNRSRGNGAALETPVTVAVENVTKPAPRLVDLAGIARDALAIRPPLYAQSIFGPLRSWLPPHRRFSEFGIASIWRPLRTLKFLQNTWLPSLPLSPPPFNPPFLNDLFWQPTVILHRPDHNGSYTSFPEESWFFINGIMTNDAVAQVNAALLSELFHRPVTLIQNSTSSLFVDLLQCALDKEGWKVSEPVTKAFPVIYDALKSPHKRRVVVIAHSQGTIIAAVVLRLLAQITRPAAMDVVPAAAYAPPEFVYPAQEPLDLSDFAPLTEAELARLELYCFATCANTMSYVREPAAGQRPVPYIEHFGNELDIVARLGMLAPRPARWEIQLQGPRFVRPRAWGHLLNEHYLYPLADAQRKGRRRGGRGYAEPFLPFAATDGIPRLYSYINGGAPSQ